MGGNSSFFLVLGLPEYSTWNAFDEGLLKLLTQA